MIENKPTTAPVTPDTKPNIAPPQSPQNFAEKKSPEPKLSGITFEIRKALQWECEPLEPEEEQRRMKEITETFKHIDTSQYIKKKQGLSYLSWAKAWELVLDCFPSAQYDVVTFDGLPWQNLGKQGANVYTAITINGVMRSMWLPIMDLRNKTLPVEQITVTEWNKSVMRCLVKNLGMFDLGLNVYNGEDISEAAAGDARELQAKIKQVFNAGKQLAATNKDDVSRLMLEIAGDSNPANIQDIETADKLLEAFKNIKPAATTKKTAAKTEEKGE